MKESLNLRVAYPLVRMKITVNSNGSADAGLYVSLSHRPLAVSFAFHPSLPKTVNNLLKRTVQVIQTNFI